jgi:hypothetical protein
MSISYAEAVHLTCPHCHIPFSNDTYIIVDAEERPELVAQILDGTLHNTVCPNCGQTGQIPAPLLYHDRLNERVLLAVPAEMPETEWREIGQTLLWTLIGALPEEQRLPYLGNVQAEAGLAGIAQVIHTENLTGSGTEEDVPPIVRAIQDLLAANGPHEMLTTLDRHPILDEPQAVTILQELAAEALKHGQSEAADGFARAADLLQQLKTFRTRSTATVGDTASSHGLDAVQVEELAFALLHSTTGQDLAQVVDQHPELLQAWSDDVLGEWAEHQRRADKPKIAEGIEERRIALQELRTRYHEQQPVLEAVQAYLEARTDDEVESVIVERDELLTDAADQALERLVNAARAEGDSQFADFVHARRTFLGQVRDAIDSDDPSHQSDQDADAI